MKIVEIVKSSFQPGPMPLCRHCVHGEAFHDAHRCVLNGRVSYFGCYEFLREPGADDDM